MEPQGNDLSHPLLSMRELLEALIASLQRILQLHPEMDLEARNALTRMVVQLQRITIERPDVLDTVMDETRGV